MVVKYAIPVGTPLPHETRLMASSLITSFRHKSAWCVALPFISSFAVNVTAIAPLSACTPAMLLSAAVHIAIAGVIVRFNIYSSLFLGTMTFTGTLLIVQLLVCVAFGYQGASTAILYAQAALSVFRSLTAFLLAIMENRLRDQPGTTLAPVLWEVTRDSIAVSMRFSNAARVRRAVDGAHEGA